MNIEYNFEKISTIEFNWEQITNWIKTIVEKNGKKVGDLNYIFSNDDYILDINKKYLNHNYYTDIITFNYVEGNLLSGDIFISVDTVNENAQHYKVSFENELCGVIIHGVLHLIGFDDQNKNDQEEMTKQENLALDLLEKLK